MARRKREPMSERKKNIIGMLLEEYDIKTAEDIHKMRLNRKWMNISGMEHMSDLTIRITTILIMQLLF